MRGRGGREEARRVNARPAGVSGRGRERRGGGGDGAPAPARAPTRAPEVPWTAWGRGGGRCPPGRCAWVKNTLQQEARRRRPGVLRLLSDRAALAAGGRTPLCPLSLRARCGGSARRQLYPLRHPPRPRAAGGGVRVVQRPVRTGSATGDAQPSQVVPPQGQGDRVRLLPGPDV